MPTTGKIFGCFLHIGLTAFGGLAMIEPMRRRVVEDKKWLTQGDFLEGLALCQVLPGATVVQLATYVGQRLRGPAGALAGAAGFVLPAFVLMTALSWLYVHYGELAFVKTLSRGLNAAVIALLVQALWRLGREVARSWFDLALSGLVFGALWLRLDYLAVFLGAGFIRLLMKTPEEPAMPAAAPLPAPPGMAPEMRAVAVFLLSVTAAVLALWFLNPLLAHLSLLMFKVGLISFGGGYVMIPVLQWEVVDRLHWLTLPQFLDGILLSYVTPGPLIILAAFTGFVVQGLLGSAVGTLAIFLPPILMVVALTPMYQKVKNAGWMRPMIRGVLAALVGMLALVTLQMGHAVITDWKTLSVALAAGIALIGFNLNLLWVIAGVAAVSLVLF